MVLLVMTGKPPSASVAVGVNVINVPSVPPCGPMAASTGGEFKIYVKAPTSIFDTCPEARLLTETSAGPAAEA